MSDEASMTIDRDPAGACEIVLFAGGFEFAFGAFFRTSRNMETSDAAIAFGALAQDTRLDLMRLLMAEGANGLPGR